MPYICTQSSNIIAFYLQQNRCEQTRFSILVKEMQQHSHEKYLATILAFINCILKRIGDLNQRIRLRNEFLGKIVVIAWLLVYTIKADSQSDARSCVALIRKTHNFFVNKFGDFLMTRCQRRETQG